MVRDAIGTLMRSQAQSTYSRVAAQRRPTAGPDQPRPYRPIAAPIFSFGTIWLEHRHRHHWQDPARTACTTRKKIISSRLPAMPHSAEAAEKPIIDRM